MIGAAIEGVSRSAVVWVDAEAGECEFGEVGAADDYRAGVSQSFDDGRVTCRRRRAGQHFRAAERNHAGFVEQIFDRNRDAGQGG